MSLRDRNFRDDVVVYLEEPFTDSDGNKRQRPSATGTPTKARIQVQGQSGTSARRAEQDNEGYETEKVYTLKFPRSFAYVIGAQSQLTWGVRSDGLPQRWVIFGDVNKYNNSTRTQHDVYTMKRY